MLASGLRETEMKVIEFMRNHSIQLLTPALIFFITLVLGFVVRRILFGTLARWAKKTSGKFDDIVVQALRGPFMIWVIMLALHLAAQLSVLPNRISDLIAKILLFLMITSLTFVGARLASETVKNYGAKVQGTLPVTSLTQNMAQVAVIIVGILILLSSLGMSITPLLTALGVGGLAVALGLQDTLANFFAGFYVSLAGYVRPGDYIKLDSGQEGYVSDIGWRSTTIRALANNLVIIPNSKLAQAIVTNYHLPEKQIGFSIPVSVSLESDPDRIEAILLDEVRKGAGEIKGLLLEPPPSVRFIPGFGSSSLDFSLSCQVAEFVDQFSVQHELRKRILKRFRLENIAIPLPARAVYIHGNSTKSGS